jgi:hypothetical protein
MAFELTDYKDYAEAADVILESETHPTNVSDEVHDAINEAAKTFEVFGRVPTLANVARAEALKVTVVSYACRVLDIVSDDDPDTMMGLVSTFIDMYGMTVGTESTETTCGSEIVELMSMIDMGFDVDMMGADIDSPPLSLDRDEVQIVDPDEHEDAFCGVDMSIAKSIIMRLSLNDEDRTELIKLADEVDGKGVPKYTTTELVNRANEMIGEYE